MNRPQASRVVPLATLACIGTVAAVVSADSLAGLALATGWPWWQSWGLPICLDAVAGFCVWRFLTAPKKSKVRLAAHVVAWLALVGSVAGNATAHFLTAPPTVQTIVVLVVASVPPLALFAVVELYAREPSRMVPPVQERRERPAKKKTAPKPSPRPLHSVPPSGDEWAAIVAWAEQYRAEKGRLPGRRPIMEAFAPMGDKRGQEYADRLKAEAA